MQYNAQWRRLLSAVKEWQTLSHEHGTYAPHQGMHPVIQRDSVDEMRGSVSLHCNKCVRFPLCMQELLGHLEEGASQIESEATWAQVIQYVAVVVCIIVALGITSSAARAVTVPFMALYKTSERLHKESRNLAIQSEATGRFVPYATLELMGVNDIVELRVGQLVLKRMTVMFGDIISFTTLSSKLVPDDVFRCHTGCAFCADVSPFVWLCGGPAAIPWPLVPSGASGSSSWLFPQGRQGPSFSPVGQGRERWTPVRV